MLGEGCGAAKRKLDYSDQPYTDETEGQLRGAEGGAGLIGKIPEVRAINEFDADLTTTLRIEVAVDDAGTRAFASIFAAKNHLAAFFDQMPADQTSAVTADRGGPGFFFPHAAGIFAPHVNRNG